MNADPTRPLPSREDYETDLMLERVRREVQFFEPTEPEPRRTPWGVLAYAASLCVVVAWLALSGVL